MASSQKHSDYDRVYMYPKSSCNCYDCKSEPPHFPPKKGVPTNLSVRDCDVSNYYDCYDRRVIDTRKQPEQKSGKYQWINPEAYSKSYSKSFAMAVDCRHPQDHCDKCPEPQFGTWDPRTWSATHNQYLTFDRPPLESTPKLKDIYNEELRGYGQGYRTYSDITAGQILYYTDPSREDAYYKPLFSHPVETSTVVYQDPMGAMKPEYPRQVPFSNPVTDNKCDYGEYCLSWIRDSQMHREDILASQMAKRNQERWMPRWANGTK